MSLHADICLLYDTAIQNTDKDTRRKIKEAYERYLKSQERKQNATK